MKLSSQAQHRNWLIAPCRVAEAQGRGLPRTDTHAWLSDPRWPIAAILADDLASPVEKHAEKIEPARGQIDRAVRPFKQSFLPLQAVQSERNVVMPDPTTRPS